MRPARRGSSPTCCTRSRSSPRPPPSSRWACRAAGARSRAIELVVGVAVGIVVADVIVRWLGANTLVLMLVVGLSMAAALLFGAGQILVNQAAISGILVVATLQPGSIPSPARALDALIGGAVALLVGQVLFPRDPVRAMAKAARPVVSDLSVALQGPRRGAARRPTRRALGARWRWPAAPTTTWPTSSTPWPLRARPSPCATRAGARASASRSTPRPPSRWTTRCATRACSPGARSTRSAATGQRPASWPTPSRSSATPYLELGNQLEHPEQDTAARRLAIEAAVKATEAAAGRAGPVDQRDHRAGPLDGDRSPARLGDDGRRGPHRPGGRGRARWRSAVAAL